MIKTILDYLNDKVQINETYPLPESRAPLAGTDLEHDERWMREALRRAELAEQSGEVPVGAVIVEAGALVGEGWNRPISACDPTAHAEIVAIREVARAKGNYRIPGHTLYVTLEPCAMCVGAMIHARIERLVFGAHDPKTGAAGSVFELIQSPRHNHRIACRGGVLELDCSRILQDFFRRRRG